MLDGYPVIGLVPKSGSISPVYSHSGQSTIFKTPVSAVTLPPSSTAGAAFVLEYNEIQQNGQPSCATVSRIKITLPGLGGTFHFNKQFFPCGAPNISVSAIVSNSRYKAAFGG